MAVAQCWGPAAWEPPSVSVVSPGFCCSAGPSPHRPLSGPRVSPLFLSGFLCVVPTAGGREQDKWECSGLPASARVRPAPAPVSCGGSLGGACGLLWFWSSGSAYPGTQWAVPGRSGCCPVHPGREGRVLHSRNAEGGTRPVCLQGPSSLILGGEPHTICLLLIVLRCREDVGGLLTLMEVCASEGTQECIHVRGEGSFGLGWWFSRSQGLGGTLSSFGDFSPTWMQACGRAAAVDLENYVCS